MEKENKKLPVSLEMTYEQFYEKYFYFFVDYCKAHSFTDEPEDIVEDAFAELWEHWDSLNSHAEFVLFKWVKEAIALIVKAYYRKRAKYPVFVESNEQIDKNYPQTANDFELSLEDDIIEKETYQYYLNEVRKRLSPKDCQLFDCIMIKKMSIKETAARLSKSEKAVSVGATRLRAKLRSRILPEIIPQEFMAKK